jgi:acyl-CoA synthetase (AMP-forming)/AMP-acid ligase II
MDNDAWSYERAGSLSCRLAAALRSADLPADAKVAVLSPNSPLAMICILGIWRAEYTWVPLSAGNRCRSVYRHALRPGGNTSPGVAAAAVMERSGVDSSWKPELPA